MTVDRLQAMSGCSEFFAQRLLGEKETPRPHHDRMTQELSMCEIVDCIGDLVKAGKPPRMQSEVSRALGWTSGRISRIMCVEGVRLSEIVAEFMEHENA